MYSYPMEGQILQVTEEERDVNSMPRQHSQPAEYWDRQHMHFTIETHTCTSGCANNVLPDLEFLVTTWAHWLEADKAVLGIVQQRAVAMVSGLVGRTYKDCLAELGMLTMEERRHQADMLQVYKIISGKDKIESENL